MDSNARQPDDTTRLKALLKEAGYLSYRMDAKRRVVLLLGRTREWCIALRAENGWLNAYTFVCRMPETDGARARVSETLLRLNAGMLLTKFVAAPEIMLEADYRLDHIDAETLKGIVGLLFNNADGHYAEIFRRVTGDDVLASLEQRSLTGVA